MMTNQRENQLQLKSKIQTLMIQRTLVTLVSVSGLKIYQLTILLRKVTLSSMDQSANRGIRSKTIAKKEA